MVVKTQHLGREVTGLMVGAANVRRYFSKSVREVRLHLGDLEIECKLNPDFWHGKPEIRDPRLTQWLEFRTRQEQLGRRPVLMAMVEAGGNSYTLHSRAAR
jgi:hypothetical protein